MTLRNVQNPVSTPVRMSSAQRCTMPSNSPMNARFVTGAWVSGWRPTATRRKARAASNPNENRRARRWLVSIGREAYPSHGGAPAPHRVRSRVSRTSATTSARGSVETAPSASITSDGSEPDAKR
jgi:hypothetical protein